MNAARVYGLLERPSLYRLAQRVLAPGAEQVFTEHLRAVVRRIPPARRVLDVGCGPSSLLWRLSLRPVGVDVSAAYTRAYHANGDFAITASAAALPIPDGAVDGVWSIGLLHHLPEAVARQVVAELMRAVRSGGYVAIFDGVLPEQPWARPLIWLQRRLDRGRHMRRQHRLESLLIGSGWQCNRVTYSPMGHEGVFCVLIKP